MEAEPIQIVPRELRHDLRGRVNGLKLCVAALESGCTAAEAAEFIDDMITLSDKILVLLDKIDAVVDSHAKGAGERR